jgi:hypothetical protein
MANTAISALPTVTTPLAGTEVLPIVQSSSTKRVTISQIASYIGSYTLPTASASVLGGIKIGSGLSIDGSGVVSASGGGASATATIQNKSAAYTVVAGDLGTIINFSSGSSVDATLPDITTVSSGFNVSIWNTSGTGISISVKPIAGQQIGTSSGNGYTNTQPFILRWGVGISLVSDGTYWHIYNAKIYGNYRNTIAIGSNAKADNNFSVAIGANTSASGVYSIALGTGNSSGGTTASSNFSTAIGSNSSDQGSQTTTGAGAMALGGSYASGVDSFAAAIANNTSTYGAQGANSIAIGKLTKATGIGSVAIGANWFGNTSATGGGSVAIGDNTTSSQSHTTAIGWESNASFENSLAIATRGARASAQNSIAIGSGLASGSFSLALGQGALANIYGKYAYAAQTGADGVVQTGTLILNQITTNATATVLTSDAGAVLATNQIILQNNSAYAFTGIIIARQQAAAGNDFAAWEIKGGIVRGATAATTALGTYNINVLSKSAGAVTWTIALSADTANGGLAITVTGAAAVNIRWVATVKTSEVTYA